MNGFCKELKLIWGGSATNGTAPFSSNMIRKFIYTRYGYVLTSTDLLNYFKLAFDCYFWYPWPLLRRSLADGNRNITIEHSTVQYNTVQCSTRLQLLPDRQLPETFGEAGGRDAAPGLGGGEGEGHHHGGGKEEGYQGAEGELE